MLLSCSCMLLPQIVEDARCKTRTTWYQARIDKYTSSTAIPCKLPEGRERDRSHLGPNGRDAHAGATGASSSRLGLNSVEGQHFFCSSMCTASLLCRGGSRPGLRKLT